MDPSLIDGVWEKDDGLVLYIHPDNVQTVKESIEDLSSTFSFKFSQKMVEAINWNTECESNFEMVTIDDQCVIYATFHQHIPDVKYRICITPKMAFGTGHHETTSMMISAMIDMKLLDTHILDWGTGTGILSLLAPQMGAKDILGIDYNQIAINESTPKK